VKPYEAVGILKSIGEEQRKTDRFTLRTFIVDMGDDKYPNEVIFQLVNSNTDLIDKFGEGQSVVLQFYIKGANAKFVNLNCVGIQLVQREVKPRKEPELPLPNEPHYANEVIPTGRRSESLPSRDNQDDSVSDLPF
jgi:hypothetical protein